VDLSPAILSQPYPPRLYNLDTDIGETTDVAAQHPEVVKQLQDYVAEMEADLGKGIEHGPGVRARGFVADPKFLTNSPKAPLVPTRIAIEYD